MRKVAFFLICALLVGCNTRNEPEEKEATKKTTKEADVVVKYYVNDSLLQYVNVSIVDSLHLNLGSLPYTTTSLDTLGADASVWKGTLGAAYRANKSLYSSLPPSTIKVLTLSRHLQQGNYTCCACFTRNSKPLYTGTIPVLVAQTSTSSIKKWNAQAQNEIEEAITATKLMSHLQGMQLKMKTTISF